MIDVFSPEGMRMVAEVGRRPSVIGLDFDGTLAPIVDDPKEARTTERTRGLLRALAVQFPCAVISGRCRVDVLERVGSAPLVAVFGNHGVEHSPDPPSQELRARIHAWVQLVRSVTTPGEVQIEDKGHTLSVHYRHARDPEGEAARIRSIASDLPAARLLGGHSVMNVLPRESSGKADAVRLLGTRFPGRPLLFLGDDEVDEDAFRSSFVTWPVRVGPSVASAARFIVESQREVDRLLQALLAARERLCTDRVWTGVPPEGPPGGGTP